MFDKVLEEYASKRNQNGSAASAGVEAADDFGAFGWLRGVQDRAIMLEIPAQGRPLLGQGLFLVPVGGIRRVERNQLNFSGETIRIAGRDLNAEARANVSLFAGIIRHRVPWRGRRMEAAVMQVAKDAIVVEEVKVK
jgi:hypothetical protein